MDCNCNCGCNGENHESEGCQHEHHEHNEKNEVIYLTLEDETEIKCEVVAIFEVGKEEYIALLPEESENVYLYKYEEIEKEPIVSIIEDDNEYEQVAEVYDSMLEEANQE